MLMLILMLMLMLNAYACVAGEDRVVRLHSYMVAPASLSIIIMFDRNLHPSRLRLNHHSHRSYHSPVQQLDHFYRPASLRVSCLCDFLKRCNFCMYVGL